VETMAKKKPLPRRSFTPEFKADIVKRCRRGDRTVGQVARDFDLTETAVREWVRQEVDTGARDGITTEERSSTTCARETGTRSRNSPRCSASGHRSCSCPGCTASSVAVSSCPIRAASVRQLAARRVPRPLRAGVDRTPLGCLLEPLGIANTRTRGACLVPFLRPAVGERGARGVDGGAVEEGGRTDREW
jgi:transposase